MGNSNGVIDSTVRQIADVKTVLGESASTLSGLCTSSRINKWAKYKPVALNSTAPNRSGTWYKGTYNDFSLNYSKQTTFSGIISAYNGGYNWDYNTPIGGSSEPYRLYDFAGYNHSALCFVQGFTYPLSYQKGGSGFTLEIQWRTGLASNTISIADLGFSTWFFGAIIDGNSVTRMIVSSTSIENGGGLSSILVPDSVLTVNKTYKVYPIVSQQYQASYGGSGVTTPTTGYAGLYTLPVSVGSVKITETVETSLNIKGGSVTVQYSSTKYTVGFTLQLILTTGFTMSNLKLQVSQCNTQDGTYTNVGSQITLNPSSIEGTGSTVKEQAYSGIEASNGNMLVNMNYVKLTVTGTNAGITYTAVAIKQMRSGEDIPLIAEN